MWAKEGAWACCLYFQVVRLADILGHSSINTTRIYTIETSEAHRVHIQKPGLLKYLYHIIHIMWYTS